MYLRIYMYLWKEGLKEGHRTRFSGHIPNKLYLTAISVFTSAITKYSMSNGNEADVLKVFKIISKQRTPPLLRFTRTIIINDFQLDFFMQKESVVNLSLSW